jgi:hypothetical protein
MGIVRHRRQKPESFAEFVGRLRSDPPEPRPDGQLWPRPIHDGHWTDDNGTDWHIRGERAAQLPHRVLRRLLKRSDLRVLHAYGLHPSEVSVLGFSCRVDIVG